MDCLHEAKTAARRRVETLVSLPDMTADEWMDALDALAHFARLAGAVGEWEAVRALMAHPDEAHHLAPSTHGLN